MAIQAIKATKAEGGKSLGDPAELAFWLFVVWIAAGFESSKNKIN